MKAFIFAILALVGRTIASLDFIYDLVQDEDLGTYYF